MGIKVISAEEQEEFKELEATHRELKRVIVRLIEMGKESEELKKFSQDAIGAMKPRIASFYLILPEAIDGFFDIASEDISAVRHFLDFRFSQLDN